MRAGLTEANPVAGALRVAAETSRERVLTPDELASIWSACREDDFGRIVRLLVLTAQRREEVGSMTWSELDLEQGLWTIPRERTKNGRSHEVPLSAAAVDILRKLPHRQGREYVFGEGAGGFSGWSKCKARLDARIAATGESLHPWRLHDLRRTAATRMAEMGTLPHVVEALLNHVSGHKAGVAGVYNRATYREEKRQALAAWSNHLHELLYS
jgi:integrase